MKQPYLISLEPARSGDDVLVLMGGGNEEGIGTMGDGAWRSLIRELGWQGAIYQLGWDDSLNISLTMVAQLESGEAIALWNRCRNQFKRIGKSFLPKLLWEVAATRVSLWSFGQGTQVAYYGMREWSEAKIHIQDVVMLAGTVRRDASKNWQRATHSLHGQLFNFYNTEDLMLHRLSNVLDWQQSPCGIKPIREISPQIVNVDATAQMQTAVYSPENCQRALAVLGQKWGE